MPGRPVIRGNFPTCLITPANGDLMRCLSGHLTACPGRVSLAILTLVNRLRICGVKVVSYQESWIEAPGEMRDLLYALTGWVARMESQRRSERTKAGLARVKAQGKRLGRPLGSKDKRKRRRKQRLIAL